MKDSTICYLFSAGAATLLAAIWDGELLLLVVGALVGGTMLGTYQRVRGE